MIEIILTISMHLRYCQLYGLPVVQLHYPPGYGYLQENGCRRIRSPLPKNWLTKTFPRTDSVKLLFKKAPTDNIQDVVAGKY